MQHDNVLLHAFSYLPWTKHGDACKDFFICSAQNQILEKVHKNFCNETNLGAEPLKKSLIKMTETKLQATSIQDMRPYYMPMPQAKTCQDMKILNAWRTRQ